MDLIKTSYRTIFRTFYQNQIPEIPTFLFIRNDYSHFVARRQIFLLSIYTFFQYKLYLKIENDISLALQFLEPLLYNHIDFNERIVILEI